MSTLRTPSIASTPDRVRRSKAVQERIDSKGRVQFGAIKVFWSRGLTTDGQVRGAGLRFILLSGGMPLQYVGRQVLGEDGFILSGHSCVLPL